MTGNVLETKGLIKKYGKHIVLDSLSLSVPRGSILGLVGPNGAGKTTWMMAVAGLIKLDGGVVNFKGSLGMLPQDSELPLEMSARSLLIGYSLLQGMTAKAARIAADEILTKLNLFERAEVSIRALSHGMKKRVMTAQCFLGDPDLVLLDEPMNGLDPLEAERLRKVILERANRKSTVISSHNLLDLERFCTHIAFINEGKVRRFGALAELTEGGKTLEDVYFEGQLTK